MAAAGQLVGRADIQDLDVLTGFDPVQQLCGRHLSRRIGFSHGWFLVLAVRLSRRAARSRGGRSRPRPDRRAIHCISRAWPGGRWAALGREGCS